MSANGQDLGRLRTYL